LPQSWNGIRLRLVRHQVLAEIEVDHKQCTVRVLDGGPLPVETADGVAELFVGEELSLPIDTDRGHWERAGQPGLGGT
jgi:hypothetical protein